MKEPTKRSDSHSRARCPGHDYYSRCIYHIVLNKADYIPRFSEIVGTLHDRNWPPYAQLTPTGQHIAEAISALKQTFPFTSILRRCIMPDHVHFVIFVKEATDIHLGTIIAHLKRECTHRYCANTTGDRPHAENDTQTEQGTHLFAPDYNDTFLRSDGQLKKMLGYVSDNPRRYLLKKLFPGNHRRFTIEIEGVCYDAYGNWDLLEIPEREAVKVSRSFLPEELLRRKRSWLTTAYNGGLLVSPFIHTDEQKVRNWGLTNLANLAIITPEPFGERYRPQGELFELCADGRGVVISSAPTGQTVAPSGKPAAQTGQTAAQTGQSPGGNCSAPTGGAPSGRPRRTQYERTKVTRSECLHMNQLAAKIAAGEFSLHF